MHLVHKITENQNESLFIITIIKTDNVDLWNRIKLQGNLMGSPDSKITY